MGMAVAGQVGIPAFLMAIMIGNGANAGSLSPIAPTGVIVNGVMDEIGLAGYEVSTYLNNMMAHMVIVLAAYFLLGGWRLLGRYHTGALVIPTRDGADDGSAGAGGAGAATDRASDGAGSFERQHWITIGVIACCWSASSSSTSTSGSARTAAPSSSHCSRRATNPQRSN